MKRSDLAAGWLKRGGESEYLPKADDDVVRHRRFHTRARDARRAQESMVLPLLLLLDLGMTYARSKVCK